MFQIERLQVLRAPLLNEVIARKRCHLAFIIICLISFVIVLPDLEMFSHFNNVLNMPCFITSNAIWPIKYFYLVTCALFYSLPFTALPILNILLVITIRQMIKAHSALIKGANSNNKRNEIKAAASSVVVSIFMSICLTPNISWIPMAYSAY